MMRRRQQERQDRMADDIVDPESVPGRPAVNFLIICTRVAKVAFTQAILQYKLLPLLVTVICNVGNFLMISRC
jgi:hypothetical protein